MKSETCPDCSATKLETRDEMETVYFLHGDERRSVAVTVPVHKCLECGLEFTTGEAETERDNAVARAKAAK